MLFRSRKICLRPRHLIEEDTIQGVRFVPTSVQIDVSSHVRSSATPIPSQDISQQDSVGVFQEGNTAFVAVVRLSAIFRARAWIDDDVESEVGICWDTVRMEPSL